MYFEPNAGQAPAEFRYLSRAGGLLLGVTASGFRMEPAGIGLRFEGSRGGGVGELEAPQPGISNYFLGNDASRWRTGVPHYGRLRIRDVYPGIDVIYYGSGGNLEYDLIAAPGADVSKVRLAFDGVDSVRGAANGDLVLKTARGEVTQHKPRVYQGDAEIAAAYEIRAGRVLFAVGPHDPRRALRIDPVLSYSATIGNAAGSGIAVDGAGNAYIAGTASSLPTTTGAYQAQLAGARDLFVLKLDSTGAVVYATFVGGSSDDSGNGIAVDAAGNAYVTGSTGSANFPVTAGAFETASPITSTNNSAFVFKLNAAGTALAYSSFLGGGGSTYGNGIAVDNAGNAYIAGYTTGTDFPTTAASYQPRIDAYSIFGGWAAFVTKVNPSGSTLVYSTYLGGTAKFSYGRADVAYGIAVDSAGNAYVTGQATSQDFPRTAGAFINPKLAQIFMGDVFVVKLNPAGSGLVYATHFGSTSASTGYGIAIDSTGSACITGGTTPFDTFPTTSGAYDTRSRGMGQAAFVTKLKPDGSGLVYSTFLGGFDPSSNASGIAVDPSGNAWVTGTTSTLDFPITPNSLRPFLSELSADGSQQLDWSFVPASVTRAIASDSMGSVYVTGQNSNGVYAAKFSPITATQIIISSVPFFGVPVQVAGTGCAPGSYTTPLALTVSPSASCTVTVGTVTASSTSRWRFLDWGPGVTSNPLVIQAPASAVTAMYTANIWLQYSLTTQAVPAGTGTIIASPDSAGGYYDSGSTVHLTAVPQTGGTFQGWTGAAAGTANPVSVIMLQANSVSAYFGAAGCSYSLSQTSVSVPFSGATGNIALAAGANCAWTASTSASWITLQNTIGTGSTSVGYTVAQLNPPPISRTGTIAIGGQTLTITQTGNYLPSVSLNPYTGSGASQTFNVNAIYTWGLQPLNFVRLSINRFDKFLSPAGGCEVELDVAGNQLRLLDDAGLTWSPPAVLGSANTLSNSQCSIAVSGAGVTGVSRLLTLTLPVTFTAALTGKANLYVDADDTAGISSGWIFTGEWWPNGVSAAPVNRYRLYDPFGHSHLFTTDTNEYAILGARGFVQEGVASRIYNGPFVNGAVATKPYFRAYNVAGKSHYWTMDIGEYLGLVNPASSGKPNTYTADGTDGHILPFQAGSAIPLYRLTYCCATPTIYHWTEDAHEYAVLSAQDWHGDGITGYVLPPNGTSPAAAHEHAATAETRFHIAGVVNAASYQPGPIAPREMVRIFGGGFSAESRVRIGGVDVELLSVTANEIVALVPDLPAGSTAVDVDQMTAEIAIAPAAPALFASDAYGRGAARVVRAGSVITVYLTGANPDLPLSASIGGRRAEVVSAETDTPGVLAVKLRVPDGLGPSPSIVIRSGEFSTQPGVVLDLE